MNRWLAHLLSRAFDGSLAPEHRDDLRRSTLTDETIAAQFIRSVPLAMLARLLGFDGPGIRSALLFPYRAPGGGFMDHVRIKVFPPLTDADGHTIKYLQPKGSAPRLYFVAGCLREVLEGEGPVWLVEGEKKALAVAQLGLPAVGLAGVEAWHVRASRLLIQDFDEIRLEGRVVELVPDGDVATNANVSLAVRRLAMALEARRARPRLVELPREIRS
jgi:putative DNA primase/helicase